MDLLWFVLMEERWQDEDSALAITLVRALWTNKNDVCHGGLKKNRKQNFHCLHNILMSTGLPRLFE